ncbi:MAG: DinB family protein [Clostridia bacterium]|nr:DinB family protein [Clostridia bacterium]
MSSLLDPAALLEVLEGNRRLTLRTIEAFPEDKLFTYRPVEPLRPFAAMVKEILDLEDGYVRGIATGEWTTQDTCAGVQTKSDLLAACERVRARTRELWQRLTVERLLTVEPDPFWGGPPQSHFERMLYTLENEIHHRGQGFIYLRLLGVEPPQFYER